MNNDDYINSVIGKPWENRAEGPLSFDCWGLVLDSFRKIDNIELHQVDGYIDIKCSTGDAAIEEIETGRWSLSEPNDNCVAVCFRGGIAIHVGRVLSGGVLHAFGKNGEGSVKWSTFRAINSIYQKVEYYAVDNPSQRSV